jgi:hypothetical protein
MDRDNETRLLSFLENYGRHFEWCETRGPDVPPPGVRVPCTCGFAGILDAESRRLFPRMYGLPYPDPVDVPAARDRNDSSQPPEGRET